MGRCHLCFGLEIPFVHKQNRDWLLLIRQKGEFRLSFIYEPSRTDVSASIGSSPQFIYRHKKAPFLPGPLCSWSATLQFYFTIDSSLLLL